jgi:hypothetical protein
MTREEFIQRYADRSNVTPEWLIEQGMIAVECSCGADNCHGWQMIDKAIHKSNLEVMGHYSDSSNPTGSSSKHYPWIRSSIPPLVRAFCTKSARVDRFAPDSASYSSFNRTAQKGNAPDRSPGRALRTIPHLH